MVGISSTSPFHADGREAKGRVKDDYERSKPRGTLADAGSIPAVSTNY